MACNASGFTPGESGAMRSWVRALDVLLPNGLRISARRGEYVSAARAFCRVAPGGEPRPADYLDLFFIMDHEERLFHGTDPVRIYLQAPLAPGAADSAAAEWLDILSTSGCGMDETAILLPDNDRDRTLFFEARHSMPANSLANAAARPFGAAARHGTYRLARSDEAAGGDSNTGHPATSGQPGAGIRHKRRAVLNVSVDDQRSV